MVPLGGRGEGRRALHLPTRDRDFRWRQRNLGHALPSQSVSHSARALLASSSASSTATAQSSSDAAQATATATAQAVANVCGGADVSAQAQAAAKSIATVSHFYRAWPEAWEWVKVFEEDTWHTLNIQGYARISIKKGHP